MNYLAHVFLARHSREAMLGAILGDFVKAPPPGTYGEEIGTEIAMHRMIDTYTDSHAMVRDSKAAFSAQSRRYSGILLDVFYDHLLSQRWSTYSSVPLDEFIRRFYEGLTAQHSILPPNFQVTARRMVTEDWLGAYRDFSGVEQAVDRIALRLLKNGHRLRDGLLDLQKHHDRLAACFDVFFPQLMAFVEHQRASGTISPGQGDELPSRRWSTAG